MGRSHLLERGSTEVTVVGVEAVDRNDPALATALAVLGLELEPIS